MSENSKWKTLAFKLLEATQNDEIQWYPGEIPDNVFTHPDELVIVDYLVTDFRGERISIYKCKAREVDRGWVIERGVFTTGLPAEKKLIWVENYRLGLNVAREEIFSFTSRNPTFQALFEAARYSGYDIPTRIEKLLRDSDELDDD